MQLVSAHHYASPRARPLTEEEREVRRIAYALKVPTDEALDVAAAALAPFVDAAEAPGVSIVLMPVPASTGSIDANRQLSNAIAAEVRRRYPGRRVAVRVTVGRMHPVESSCARRRRGERGLRADDHAMIRVAGPLTATETAYYFVDNMFATGATIGAARQALGFGGALVWAHA